MKSIKITDEIVKIMAEDGDSLLETVQATLDMIAAVWEAGDYKKIILDKKDVAEEFFDLKNKIAGESLQKLVNYNFRVVIVGDFSTYTSNSLKDFIRESNKGRSINFLGTEAEAIESLNS